MTTLTKKIGSPDSGGTTTTTTSLPNMASKTFDLSRFAVGTEVEEFARGRKLLNIVPVRKPMKENWIRTHPNIKNYWVTTYIIEFKQLNESYLVSPDIRDFLMERGEQTLSRQVLVTSITRQGTLFLWPVRMPTSDGTPNSWNDSALDAAQRARTTWVRLQADRSLQAYALTVRDGGSDPAWPTIPMSEIIQIAFKGKIIESLSHPRLAELLGNDIATNVQDPMDVLLGQLNHNLSSVNQPHPDVEVHP